MHCAPTKLAASLPEQSDCISNLNRAAPTLFYICFMAVTVFSLPLFFSLFSVPLFVGLLALYIVLCQIILLTAIFRHHVVLRDSTLLRFLFTVGDSELHSRTSSKFASARFETSLSLSLPSVFPPRKDRGRIAWVTDGP